MPKIPRRLFITHGTHFEQWGPETPDQRGIGQSETANIELAQRLAKRGWDVTCYAPIPDDCPREHKGVHWRTMEEIDWSHPGYWLIFRQPELLDKFEPILQLKATPEDPDVFMEDGYAIKRRDQWIGLVSQDEDYPGRWNDDRCAKLDALFALCEAHKRSLEGDHAALKGKVLVAANGIKMDLLRAADEANETRDPHRIMWASSPDRGLLNLLKIFRRLRQDWISDASLYIAYGFDNIDKLVALDSKQFAWMQKAKDEILHEADQPGVHWLGRIPQPQLMREWAKTGMIVYPSMFRETFCSTHCEAQAMGAIPVCSPVWALGEHAKGGSLVVGDPNEALCRSRFVSEIYRWMVSGERGEFIRRVISLEARMAYDWERAVDLYEAYMLGYYAPERLIGHQFNFQIKQCLGSDSILNIGCADDPAKLKDLGAVNLDSRREDPIFHRPTAADIVADMRDLSTLDGQQFDRLVYGDCLEHFAPDVVPFILQEGVKHLAPGGRIVITVPEDHREPGTQHVSSDGTEKYHDGVSAVHLYPVTRALIDRWLKGAGLVALEEQDSECFYYINHGVAAVREGE